MKILEENTNFRPVWGKLKMLTLSEKAQDLCNL